MNFLINFIKNKLTPRSLTISVLVIMGSCLIAGGYVIRSDKDPDKELFESQVETEVIRVAEVQKTKPEIEQEPEQESKVSTESLETSEIPSANKETGMTDITQTPSPDKSELSESETSKGIPNPFNPETPVFRARMMAWRVRILTMLPKVNTKKRATYKISYSDDQSTKQIKITSGGIKRLKNNRKPKFGRLKKDEVYYLQFLAAYHGKSVIIDGDMGPNTIKALKNLMQSKYQVGDEEWVAYEKLLKKYK